MKNSNTAVKNISLVIAGVISLVLCFYIGAFMLTFDAINAIDSGVIITMALVSCAVQAFVSYRLNVNIGIPKNAEIVIGTIVTIIASMISIEIATSMIPWIVVSPFALLFKKK